MSNIWTDIRKVKAMAESGIDPDHYRFVTSLGEAGAIEDALLEMGVSEDDIDIYLIDESAIVDPGQVLIMDLKLMEENFLQMMKSWQAIHPTA